MSRNRKNDMSRNDMSRNNMSRNRNNAVVDYTRNRSGAMSKNRPKQRRGAVSDVGTIISRFICDDPICKGEVAKWGPFYLEYIGKILSEKPISQGFFDRWDNAIVAQMNSPFIKTVEALKKEKQYKEIEIARERWKREAQKWGFEEWKSKVKEALKVRGKDDRTIRRNIRDAIRYKELQLKF